MFDKNKKCGFTGKKCNEHDCMFYQQFRGQNPQTGQEEDKWECSQVMLPILLIENARQTRSVAAAAESSRNTMADLLSGAIAENNLKAIGGGYGS